ncbi:MAG: PepSY-like domain-containing protein [Spirosomataceae bacterium]
MKNILLYIYIIFFLFSCDNIKDLQPVQKPNEAVPQVAINAIRREFPEATSMRFSTIEKNKIWESDFKVRIQQMSAVVNSGGEITEAYQIGRDGVKLPENAQKYIETNYSGATIKNIAEQLGKDQKVVGYRVVIITKDFKEITIFFDATGALLLNIPNESIGNNPPRPQNYLIGEKDLPAAIISILSTKHSGYKFIKACVVIQNNQKIYKVLISKDFTTYDYTFDESGGILSLNSLGVNTTPPPNKTSDKPLEEKDLPKKIEEYLEKNYHDFDYQRGVVIYQNDKIVGYLLVIKYKEKILCLNFDASGTFLKADECGESKDGQKIQMIDPNALPDAIKKEILKRHVENYKILFASVTMRGNRKMFLVTVLKDSNSFTYEFEESGKVISEKKISMPQLPNLQVQEKQFESKDLPIKIKEYLDKNFVGWQFVKGLELLINSKLDRYLVVIKFGNDYYYVSFDPSGTFLGARKG